MLAVFTLGSTTIKKIVNDLHRRIELDVEETEIKFKQLAMTVGNDSHCQLFKFDCYIVLHFQCYISSVKKLWTMLLYTYGTYLIPLS